MALTIDESLLKTAEDLDPKDKSDRDTTPGRLLDLFVLVLTIDAYRMAGAEDEHLNKGLALYRMHRSSIEAAAAKHIETLMDRPDAGTIKSKYRLIEQLDPSRKARFVEDLMVWLRHRSALMRDVFPKRVYTNAVKVAAACEEEDVAIRVQRLAIVPTSSGLSTMFRWVKKTAEVLGSPPDTVDVVAAEAEGARGIATELKEVTQKLAAEPKASPIRAELEDKQLDLRADLSEAIGDSEDPQTTMSAAATRLSSESKVAQKFGLTPEQEDVMHSMGKLVIAAGAGSGKTMTIVATIADLVEERGYQPNQIMTCSFTRAASSQLESRVENAGIHGARIGTTHSIAREIIKRHRPDLEQAVNSVKNADKLFKMAMKQVPLSVELYQQSIEKNTESMKRIEAIPGWQDLDILRSFHTQLSRGKILSPKQEAVITKFESGGGSGGGGRGRPYYKRYAEEDKPLVEAVRSVLAPTAPPVTAAYSEPFGEQISKYWTTPVGQWFNLGVQIVDALGKPIGEKRAKLYVENFKNAGQSVEAVREELGETNPLAALYAAYEWLKQNDPVLAPAMDYTDQLVTALNLLKDNPEARDAEQRRYKVVLVDESQDLNQIQYDMFSILGEKADLYACIGDDKQSIYAFRGAKPSNFVTETKKEGVQTKLLTMNFRSGKAIVEAANKLIAHNEDRQIPMVCDADAGRKGMGAIRAKDALTHEDAADQVAQEIKDACDAGDSPKDFGILVRNNAEADAYTLSLLVRGVPYRMLKKSEGGYFGKPLVKALTAWIRLAIGGNKDEVNEAVLDAHMTPGFGLDRQFGTGLSRNTRGESYLDHIMAEKPVYTGNAYWMNKKVAEYAGVIRTIRAQGGADSPSLIRAILNVKGSKGTFEDALLKLVDEEDIIEDEGLEAGEEALRNAAMAPLRPLMVMAENFKDPEVLLQFIAKMKAANEKAQKKDPTDKDDWKEPAVLVGTVHGWKGLEAKHVYVCMAGGVFPNFKTDEKAAEDPTAYDEERRLAYVAITRGEQSVTIMAPQTNYNGKAAGTSRFIDEACIQLIEKPSDHPEMDPNTSQLTVSDPSQEESDMKTAKVQSGSFRDALALYASPVVSFDHDDYPEFDLPEIEIHAANTIEELATQLHNDLTGVKDAHDLAVEAAENNIILLANTIQEKRACEGACGNTDCKCEGTCTCGGNCSKDPEYNYDFS